MKRSLMLACLALLLSAAPASAGDRLFAATDAVPPHLVAFDSTTPGTLLFDRTITGIGAGETIVGLDSRPATGGIYILTRNGTSDGRLYTIDPATGTATISTPLTADPADMTSPYGGLVAGPIAVDFNPVPDRLRITTSTGQHMRVNPASGSVITDTDINPGTPAIESAAYSNNVPGPPSTTLYVYAKQTESLGIVTPPNNGTFVNVGPSGLTTGDSTFGAFDIAPGGGAYATHLVGGTPGLYTVDLATGAHTLVGAVASNLLGLTASTANLTSIAAATQTVGEGDAGPTITLTRAQPRGALALKWTASGGTATAGEDYPRTSGTFTFADGATSASTTIPLDDDGVDEPDETFDVEVSFDGNQDGTLLSGKQTVTITDDDPPGAIGPDGDSDGVADKTDNCPNVANSDQADGNGNGVGKACDLSEVPVVPPPTTTPPPKPGRCANAQTGTAKDDGLVGTAAGDLLSGLAGADALFAGAGDDCLTGDAGDDWLSGGDGNDDLKGGTGNDIVYGGNGNDTIDGGKGVNVIKAGAGNDTIKAKNKKRETIDCGAGKDKVTADKTDKLKGCETKKL